MYPRSPNSISKSQHSVRAAYRRRTHYYHYSTVGLYVRSVHIIHPSRVNFTCVRSSRACPWLPDSVHIKTLLFAKPANWIRIKRVTRHLASPPTHVPCAPPPPIAFSGIALWVAWQIIISRYYIPNYIFVLMRRKNLAPHSDSGTSPPMSAISPPRKIHLAEVCANILKI